MTPITSYQQSEPIAGAVAKDVPEFGVDQGTCPDCDTHLSVPHDSDGQVVFCPACGQCVSAPVPWSPGLTEWGLARPHWPYSDEKYPGSVGIGAGLLLGAVWLLPISVYLRAGAVLLGGSLFFEGIGRLWADAQRKRPTRRAGRIFLPAVMPEEADQLGALKAVYPTSNSWTDSIAICLLGLAFAAAGGWILDWMLEGMFHPKLVLGVVLAPAALFYLLYRSARHCIDRQVLFVFAEGLLRIRRGCCEVYPRDAITSISTENVGDALDEHAVCISLARGRGPLRFTRCQFPRIELLWQRLVQEFNPAVHRLLGPECCKPRSGDDM